MSVPGAVPTTSNSPTATEQPRTGAPDAPGQPTGDNPTGGGGRAYIKSRR